MPLLRQVHPVPDLPASPSQPFIVSNIGVTVPRPNVSADRSTAMFANAAYFTSKCRASDRVGAWVVAVGDIPKVRTATADEAYPVVGLIVEKYNYTECVVQRLGKSDFTFDNLQAGKRYFLGLNGSMLTPPLPDDSIEYVQQVGYALDEDDFFVQCTQQIMRRELAQPLEIEFGDGDPVDGQSYEATNIYIDTKNYVAYLAATPAGEDSVIYSGNGPPGDTLSAPQKLYIDRDSSRIYLTLNAQSGGPSAIIVGSGEPTENQKATQAVWYFDQVDGELFPRDAGQ